MIKLSNGGIFVLNRNKFVSSEKEAMEIVGDNVSVASAKEGTMAYAILNTHNVGDSENLKLKFDALASHDITYVGIIQTARASGMKKFPVPYVLTNCHNSLCAVGGTINEDDHKFALSAAKKYGGIYVPTNIGVIHSYNREMIAKCGSMVLGSDSHTRYGALGTMAIGEGGGELVKQLLEKTYDIKRPEVVGVHLTGKLADYAGPHDVALTIIKAVFANGFVKNKVMEFFGEGISTLSVETRNAIDVMTTETTCLTSIWETDEQVEEYYETHNRKQDYSKLSVGSVAYYDGLIEIDLSKIVPMIALPFHPSNVYTIEELKANPEEILKSINEDAKDIFENTDIDFDLTKKLKDGKIHVDQGIIAGCAGGTFDNIVSASNILRGKNIGNGSFTLSFYPGSQPANLELIRCGASADLLEAGAIIRSAFCGPCFGAGDTPANNELSIRHTTRNFPNREGSKPQDGQISGVALMDAKSIAATAVNGGVLTGADELSFDNTIPKYHFNKAIYERRVFNGYGSEDSEADLQFGPNIKDWPDFEELGENLLLKVASFLTDEVTTTDELIPSGETSSYRSNPYKLSEFTLSRKDAGYVGRAKLVQAFEKNRLARSFDDEIANVVADLKCNTGNVTIGSVIFAKNPGDGSAREHAASCQKVLGGSANIALDYATKRYRSNLINWGIIPFIIDEDNVQFELDDYIFVPDIRKAILNGDTEFSAFVVNKQMKEITLKISELTTDEREILVKGCLINYYRG